METVLAKLKVYKESLETVLAKLKVYKESLYTLVQQESPTKLGFLSFSASPYTKKNSEIFPKNLKIIEPVYKFKLFKRMGV